MSHVAAKSAALGAGVGGAVGVKTRGALRSALGDVGNRQVIGNAGAAAQGAIKKGLAQQGEGGGKPFDSY